MNAAQNAAGLRILPALPQVSTADSAQLFAALGIDNSWSFKKFKKNFKVVVNWVRGNDIEFELIGTNAAIVNALRRILIAEVPTMAIEHVFIINNTSIIAVSISQDAVTRNPCCKHTHYKHAPATSAALGGMKHAD